jgi:hypothetical protein
LHPLFAVESAPKRIGMGSAAFFHCSSRFYNRHRKSYQTGRLRVEESTYFYSVDEEEEYLSDSSADVLNKVLRVVEEKGK